MSSGPLPLLPPPPLPPRRPQSEVKPSLIAHLPSECRPQVDSLMNLVVNIVNDDCFDQEERQRLQSSSLGNELDKAVLGNCNEARERVLATAKIFNDAASLEPVKEDEKVIEENLVQLQTCVLREVCPRRFDNFEKCWQNVARGMMRRGGRQQFEVSKSTCRSERQAVERCAGELVARAVREAIMEDSLEEVGGFEPL